MAKRQTQTQTSTPNASTVHRLTRNANGRQAGETFSTEAARQSGIDPQRFDPPLPIDRAMKSPR